jgi:hypothetical protein
LEPLILPYMEGNSFRVIIESRGEGLAECSLEQVEWSGKCSGRLDIVSNGIRYQKRLEPTSTYSPHSQMMINTKDSDWRFLTCLASALQRYSYYPEHRCAVLWYL